jgi:nucleoside-diphosphate-sugar epimerase
MAKYLVTGAAGFIARKVIENLAAQGHESLGRQFERLL